MSLILAEDRGAIRHIVLNRPEKRNAMNQALLHSSATRCARPQTMTRCTVWSCAARGRCSRPASTSRS